MNLPNGTPPKITTKMDPAQKAAWLKALGSRKYKPGKNYLRRITLDVPGNEELQWCCIGVLADTVDSSRWEYHYPACSFGPYRTLRAPGSPGTDSFIPTGTVRGVSLTVQRYLAQNNDAGVSWSLIRKWIKENL